ncbi:MAG: hypothetical protein AB2L24_20130 [Mangrovibacterium sp.]
MKKKCLVVLCCGLLFLGGTCKQKQNISSAGNRGPLQEEAYRLLSQWCETALKYQVAHDDRALDGGLLCPGCVFIHGRCMDMVLPFMYMASQTGDKRYVEAAQKLMRWSKNVKRPSGAWINDVNGMWTGTTVFGAIALHEALTRHGQLLDDSVRQEWTQDLLDATRFVYNSDAISNIDYWNRSNINYCASAPYLLYAVGTDHHIPEYKEKAIRLGREIRTFFTENDALLYGEGPHKEKTPKGCLPVDLGYNVEESLPNLVQYAYLAGDDSLKAYLSRSVRAHLEFMLPDGGWDNSFGTRSFKWTYWGSRTSDGCMSLYRLGTENAQVDEAIRRNIRLLAECSHGELLYGGRDYKENGVAPCIHHTFGHAKALASFLNQPVHPYTPTTLPREEGYGVKQFKDIYTWLVSTGDWTATVTGYDAEYRVKGIHPSGGALSMLWHKKTGPIFAASMNNYTLVEPMNMQVNPQRFQWCGTPRVECVFNGIMYSNLDDLTAKITYKQTDEGYQFRTEAILVDKNQRNHPNGKITVELSYLFTANGVRIETDVLSAPPGVENIRLVLPVIAKREAAVKYEAASKARKLIIAGSEADIRLTSTTLIMLLPSNDGRILSMVPGFSFVPVAVPINGNAMVEIDLINN